MLFSSDLDLQDHISLAHRCQWLMVDGTCFKPCNYVPNTEEDLLAHVHTHILQGEIIVQERYDRHDVVATSSSTKKSVIFAHGRIVLVLLIL